MEQHKRARWNRRSRKWNRVFLWFPFYPRLGEATSSLIFWSKQHIV